MRPVLLSLILLALLPAAVGTTQSADDPWVAKNLERAALEKALAETEDAAKAISESEKPETEAGKRRAQLAARAALINELLAALDRQTRAGDALKGLPAVDAIKKEIAAVEAVPLPASPATPDPKEYERLRAERTAAAAQQKARADELESLEKRMAGAAQRLVAERSRASEARAAADTQEKGVAGSTVASPEHAAKIEALRSVRLLMRTAAESIRALEAEEAVDEATRPVLVQQVDLARKRFERLVKRVDAYHEAVKKWLKTEQDQRKSDVGDAREKLDKLDRRVKKEKTEAARAQLEKQLAWDRLLANKNLAYATQRLELARLRARKTKLSRLRSVQDGQKDFDETLFQRRLDFVANTGNARAASELLKKVNSKIDERRQEIADVRQGGVLQELDILFELQLKIDDEVQTLEQDWEDEFERAMKASSELGQDSGETLDSYLVTSRRVELRQLRSKYRKLLQEGLMPLLEQLRLEREKLGNVLDAHEKILDETQTKIRARFLWYRDAPVLGTEVLTLALAELETLPDKAGRLHDTEAMSREVSRRPLVEMIAFAVAFLFLLPAGLVLLRLRLFRLHSRLIESRGREAPRVRILLLGSLRVALFPIYAYGLASLVAFAPLHAAASATAKIALVLLGHSFLVLGLTRVLFGRNGIAISLYSMMEDTARIIRRTVVLLLLASLMFLLPWAVLRQDPPFGFLHLPRIAYTLFETCALVALVMVLRRNSPVMRDLASRAVSVGVRRLWRIVGLAGIALGCGSVVLDVLGHRFVAFEIAMRLVISLGVVFVLVGVFIAILPRIDDVLRRRVGKLTTAPGETEGASAWEFGRQLRRFLSGFFLLVMVVTFAKLWGLDRRALDALDQIPLYTVATNPDGTSLVASAGDLASCLIIITLTVWLLRYLSGIYELLIYPRVRWDSGLRYAVLAISRYTIAFVGVVVALGAIHLNLGRLGWLMAAVGVGLGFGMGEIVSNFVSGIILLVERPIRVGDIVTIGTVSGVVTRINIRATTVRNWDRLEVVLPNKDLITKEVTNWTLGDTTTRVTVKIGVAYGTDIELVRKILHEIVAEQPEVLKEPEPTIIFMAHGESSLDFEVRIFLAKTAERMPLLDRVNVLINRRLAEHNIEIPFPQRDLHIRRPGDASEPTPEPIPEAGPTPSEPEEPAPGAPTVEGMGRSGAEA